MSEGHNPGIKLESDTTQLSNIAKDASYFIFVTDYLDSLELSVNHDDSPPLKD